jgi:energy-coupling factor transporter ATP-binding protein EcfA2
VDAIGSWPSEQAMRATGEPSEPFGWWGPFADGPVGRRLDELVRAGVVDPPLLGLLQALLERRRSLVVVAGPSGAGKTTLLTALLGLLPDGLTRRYVRGCYEPFDFLGRDAAPERTVLLVNEISPHLPIYLWGAGLRRLLAAANDGYQVLATAHATGAADLIAQLAGYPLRLPAGAIVALEHVLWLDAWVEEGEVRRQARTLERLVAIEGGGIEVACLARRARASPLSTLDLDSVAISLDEVARRGTPFQAMAAAKLSRSSTPGPGRSP